MESSYQMSAVQFRLTVGKSKTNHSFVEFELQSDFEEGTDDSYMFYMYYGNSGSKSFTNSPLVDMMCSSVRQCINIIQFIQLRR